MYEKTLTVLHTSIPIRHAPCQSARHSTQYAQAPPHSPFPPFPTLPRSPHPRAYTHGRFRQAASEEQCVSSSHQSRPPARYNFNSGRSAGAEPGGNRRQALLPNASTETESADAGPLPTTPMRFGPILARCRQSTAPEERRQCQHERPPLQPSGESHHRASRAPDCPSGHEQGAPCLGLPTDPFRRAYGPLCPVAGALPPRPMECVRPNRNEPAHPSSARGSDCSDDCSFFIRLIKARLSSSERSISSRWEK